MKVLIPLEHEWMYTNPFVGVIYDEFKKYNDVEISTGVDFFWNPVMHYDIVHIFWPQCLLQGKYCHKSLKELSDRLKRFKAEDTKIISTCLNLVAHYSKNNNLNDSYNLVYSNSDTIIHLAEYSLNLLKDKYPSAHNVIIEHHVYDTLYKARPSREDALKELGLNSDDNFILSFGTYRSEDEREFVFKVAREVYKRTKYKFLIPSLYQLNWNSNSHKNYKYYLRVLYYKLKMITRPYIVYGHDYVDKLLPEYYVASDISFIQRIKILNSGNISMGFFWGHVVVGTQEACVGDVLRKMNNPTFDYQDIESVIAAVQDAITKSKSQVGIHNREYVMQNCTVGMTVSKIYHIYLNNVSNTLMC